MKGSNNNKKELKNDAIATSEIMSTEITVKTCFSILDILMYLITIKFCVLDGLKLKTCFGTRDLCVGTCVVSARAQQRRQRTSCMALTKPIPLMK